MEKQVLIILRVSDDLFLPKRTDQQTSVGCSSMHDAFERVFQICISLNTDPDLDPGFFMTNILHKKIVFTIFVTICYLDPH